MMKVRRHPELTFDRNGVEHCLICQQQLVECSCLPLAIHYVTLFLEKMNRAEEQLAAVRNVMGGHRHTDAKCTVCELNNALNEPEKTRE